jgi:hypothetical protein
MVKTLEQMHAEGGWIGVDMDGTLAYYDKWTGWNEFGSPIPAMASRVIRWLHEGRDVRILTARIGLPMGITPRWGVPASSARYSRVKRHHCKLTGDKFSDRDMADAIGEWTLRNVGKTLWAQCYKDFMMVEYWDDRCVQVVPNTGLSIEEHLREMGR